MPGIPDGIVEIFPPAAASLPDRIETVDNLDAIELYHDVLTRVWERLRSGESVTENIGDLQGYAAAITHNVSFKRPDCKKCSADE